MRSGRKHQHPRSWRLLMKGSPSYSEDALEVCKKFVRTLKLPDTWMIRIRESLCREVEGNE
uniref:Uncharacterized protein n=1 Tax=Lepeophtheirus salmonis TaxID=72036 RepID=A0A0K2V4U8_LEPSM